MMKLLFLKTLRPVDGAFLHECILKFSFFESPIAYDSTIMLQYKTMKLVER